MNVYGKRVLVVGLARSGLAVAHALVRRGAVVTVTDNKPPAEFCEILPQLIKEKVGLELGSQRVETFLRHQLIVISPGVPWDLPQLQAARERMIPVYPEVEAASWFLEGTLVGVTGSNGKTTTTALLGDMLKASGFPTFVGGNIGNALSSAVDQAPAGTRFVTELSSFQLEGIHDFQPHVAVMLNLSPNHLDRHPSLEAYAQAKQRIFRNQKGRDYAILNADDPWVAGLQPTVPSRVVFFSRRRELPSGVFVSGGRVCYRVRHLERVLFDASDVALRGDFNLEDVLAAATAACVLGADFAAIRRAVRAFQAVEHRLEFVREIQGVEFYNNSKATSVDATAKSLEAFARGVHLIMGGKDKGAPYTPLLPLIKDRVREVLLIGAAAPVIARQLAGSTELVQAGDLATAVYEAFARSRPGDTVLLAPACSSFDQFHDYEERGRVFKELVLRLATDVSAGRVVRSPKPEVRSPESEVRSPKAGFRSQDSGIRSQEPGVRSQEPGVRSPEPGVRSPEARVGGREFGISNLESGIAAGKPEVESPPEILEQTAAPPEEIEAASVITAPLQKAEGREAARVPLPHPEAGEDTLPRLQFAEESEDAIAGAPRTEADEEVATPLHHTAGGQDDEAPLLNKEGCPKGGAVESAHHHVEPSMSVPSPVSAPRHVELSYVYEVDAVELPGSESQVLPEDDFSIPLSGSAPEILDDEVLPYEARVTVGGGGEVRTPKSRGKRKSGVRSPNSEVRTPDSGPRTPD
jgi:UDP-N-acetylmuramoylalanine--D-glutamate ligase